MFSGQAERTLKRDLLIAALLLVSGLALSGISLIKIANSDVHLAQATALAILAACCVRQACGVQARR
jgi:hypothetical protein